MTPTVSQAQSYLEVFHRDYRATSNTLPAAEGSVTINKLT